MLDLIFYLSQDYFNLKFVSRKMSKIQLIREAFKEVLEILVRI